MNLLAGNFLKNNAIYVKFTDIVRKEIQNQDTSIVTYTCICTEIDTQRENSKERLYIYI